MLKNSKRRRKSFNLSARHCLKDAVSLLPPPPDASLYKFVEFTTEITHVKQFRVPTFLVLLNGFEIIIF